MLPAVETSYIAEHTSLAAGVSPHYLQNCVDDIAYDCIGGRSPAYFRDVCVPVVSVTFPSRLRSADNYIYDMIVPRARTVHYGPRSFRVMAPSSGTRCHLDSRTLISVVLFNAQYTPPTPTRRNCRVASRRGCEHTADATKLSRRRCEHTRRQW